MSESARRTLRILKAMRGKTLQGMTVSEIAQSTNESSTNVCRGLDDLVAEGLAAKLETGRYAHTVQLLQIANEHARETERSKARLAEMEQRVTRNHG
jgi:DNA-binding IclR family transcriptional regulator